MIEHGDHLFEHRRFSVEQIVSEDHGERLVTDDPLSAQHRVTEPQRLGLTHVEEIDMAGFDALHQVEQCLLAACLQLRLNLIGLIEVILDSALATARDKDHFGHTRCDGFFDSVLDQWFIDDRQHLFGACLCCRKKPRT